MKLSIEQANSLFDKMGVSAEVVEADKADKDVDIDAAVAEYEEDKKSAYRPEIEAEMKDSIEKASTGKVHGAVASAISRALGISKSELNGIDKVEDVVKKAKELYDSKQGNTKQEWETERNQMREEWDAEREEWERKHADEVSGRTNDNAGWQTKYDDHFINSEFISAMNKAAKKAGDTIELADIARYSMGKNYNFKYNHDTKKLEAFTKDGKPAKNFDLAKEVDSYLEKTGNKVTDTRHVPPAQRAANPQYQNMPERPKQNGNINKAFQNIVTE